MAGDKYLATEPVPFACPNIILPAIIDFLLDFDFDLFQTHVLEPSSTESIAAHRNDT